MNMGVVGSQTQPTWPVPQAGYGSKGHADRLPGVWLLARGSASTRGEDGEIPWQASWQVSWYFWGRNQHHQLRPLTQEPESICAIQEEWSKTWNILEHFQSRFPWRTECMCHAACQCVDPGANPHLTLTSWKWESLHQNPSIFFWCP